MTLTVQDLVTNTPAMHRDEAGRPISWGLAPDVLEFLDKHVGTSSVTLETGGGISTIVFALKGARHTCIVPHADEVARISEYCALHSIPTHSVRFVIARSEAALPGLDVEELDLVLIDGRHAFPTPFIDWFYATSRLRSGGTLIVDDVQLWTCRILKDFLAAEPEWQLIHEFSRSAVFTKLRAGGEFKEWNEQPYTLQQTARA